MSKKQSQYTKASDSSNRKNEAHDACEAFLNICGEFQLGKLITEQPHPNTQDLQELTVHQPEEAIRRLIHVDKDALSTLIDPSVMGKIEKLSIAIRQCWERGGKVYLAGCGATGRLCITLEALARKRKDKPDASCPVVGFMAGGDAALIRSIENFEDHFEYGARQLQQLGFTAEDLCVGISEGGETPFVIGAVERALSLGSENVWFCYCNPDEILKEVASRSRRILENNSVQLLNLTCGPMALSGSTRMQACSVQYAAIGSALFFGDTREDLQRALHQCLALPDCLPIKPLAHLSCAEQAIYEAGAYLSYHADSNYALSLLTDTTERSPTFSMRPFENHFDNPDPTQRSLCYFILKDSIHSEHAWHELLGRPPRCLDWPGHHQETSVDRLLGYDISNASPRAGRQVDGVPQHHLFIIEFNDSVNFELDGSALVSLNIEKLSLMHQNLLMKLCLNMHSTVIMGRMARYEHNIMSWVKPANYKLIDRAIRYTQQLTKAKQGNDPSYEQCAYTLFSVIQNTEPTEPIVLKTVRMLTNTGEA